VEASAGNTGIGLVRAIALDWTWDGRVMSLASVPQKVLMTIDTELDLIIGTKRMES
jgi:hypothetical protein